MFRKTLLALVLTASGLVHAQIPISGLPNASLPLGNADQIIVNQKVTSTAYSTRQAPLSALSPFFPSLTSHYILQSADPTLTQSRVLAGTANQVVLTDGGALGNLTLSLPQSICISCSPTFGGLTLTGALNGTSGVFSGSLSSAGYSGTAGTFTGALSSAGYTGTTGVFTSTLQAASLSLTTPLQATSGGTGFGSYAVGDLLAASTTTALSKLSDVAAGSYLRSGGVSTLPIWSTLTLPNAATTGDVLIATGTNAIGSLADVTAGSYLRSNGAGAAPVYSTVKIPNTAVIGDIWYGSAANTITALTGNITTGVQFLAQTGSGAASTAPVWTTLPGSFTGFANPSGLIGMSAVNGAATTATRSDATHAIDPAIAPTWSGQHIFSQAFSTTGTAGNSPIALRSTQPGISWSATGQAADTKVWDQLVTTTHLITQIDNDAGSVSKTVMDVNRSGNTVASITLGNATDLPPVNLPGGFLAAGGRPTTSSGTSSVSGGASVGGLPQLTMINNTGAADGKIWDFVVNPSTDYVGRLVNDAQSGSTTWIDVTRSGTTVAGITFPNGAVRSSTGSTAANNATATTIFTMPGNVNGQTYLVSCYVANANDVANFGATSMVFGASTVAKATSLQTAALMTITTSAMNIQCTQSSGASNTIVWSVFRWGN